MEVLSDEYARWKQTFTGTTYASLQREEEIYRNADMIVVPSQASKRSFIQQGIVDSKVKVIPYGVDISAFTARPNHQHEYFDVLFVGQVSLRKGIPYLLRAFERFNHLRKRLRVVGSLQEGMQEVLSKLPLDHVEFLGSVSQRDVAKLMSESTVLVLPSVEEGLALVQAQALASGCPVIATRATGAEDLFTDGQEGFIVEDRDEAAIASRLQLLADAPLLRDAMALKGRLLMECRAGWGDYGSKWEDLISALLPGPQSDVISHR